MEIQWPQIRAIKAAKTRARPLCAKGKNRPKIDKVLFKKSSRQSRCPKQNNILQGKQKFRFCLAFHNA